MVGWPHMLSRGLQSALRLKAVTADHVRAVRKVRQGGRPGRHAGVLAGRALLWGASACSCSRRDPGSKRLGRHDLRTQSQLDRGIGLWTLQTNKPCLLLLLACLSVASRQVVEVWKRRDKLDGGVLAMAEAILAEQEGLLRPESQQHLQPPQHNAQQQQGPQAANGGPGQDGGDPDGGRGHLRRCVYPTCAGCMLLNGLAEWVSLWQGEVKLAGLTFPACHPRPSGASTTSWPCRGRCGCTASCTAAAAAATAAVRRWRSTTSTASALWPTAACWTTPMAVCRGRTRQAARLLGRRARRWALGRASRGAGWWRWTSRWMTTSLTFRVGARNAGGNAVHDVPRFCALVGPLTRSPPLLSTLTRTGTVTWRDVVAVQLPQFNPASPARGGPPPAVVTPPHPDLEHLLRSGRRGAQHTPSVTRYPGAASGGQAFGTPLMSSGAGGGGDAALAEPPLRTTSGPPIIGLTPPAVDDELDTWAYGGELGTGGASRPAAAAAGPSAPGTAGRGGSAAPPSVGPGGRGTGAGGEEEGGANLFDMPAAPSHEVASTGRR